MMTTVKTVGGAHECACRVAPQPFNLDLNSSAKGCGGVSFLPPLHMCCILARWQQPWRLPSHGYVPRLRHRREER